MWDATFDPWRDADSLLAAARILVAATAAGVAVKLMDDVLDNDVDRLAGRTTVVAALGPGAVAYALGALAVAMLLDARVGGTLFLAAYAVGMAGTPRWRLPTGLASWQESLLAAGTAALLAGPWTMLASLSAMVFVQAVDDLLDAPGDRGCGKRSWVHRVGAVETGLLAGAALLVAVTLSPLLMTAVAVATATVESCLEWACVRLLPAAGERVGEGSG